jgi:FkbM family methyltransferase
MAETLRTASGVVRSLRIYYGDAARRAAMDRLYSRFVKPGDLAFDIGAHVGDRVGSFRRLGARVIAVEPQPALARVLRLLYGRDSEVAIEDVAVGCGAGEIVLHVNVANPTVSTASSEFVAAAKNAEGWQAEQWPHTLNVPLVTLDHLIARHGMPAFIKIDVEGLEADVLAGLSRQVPALSFEFTTIQHDVAVAALARCGELGYARFNAALGESQQFVHENWIDREAMRHWLASLPHSANSGDIYATQA